MSSTDVYTNDGRKAGWIPAETPLPKWTLESGRIIQHVKVDSTTDAPIYADLTNVARKDTLNSSSTLLLADAVFTGQAVNVAEYAEITVTISSDVVGASDGIEVQFSDDGINDWHTGEAWEYDTANAYKTWKTQRIELFYRIKYTNGGSDQTHFHLTTIISKVAGVQWSHRIKDDISGQDDAGLVKAILAAERAASPDVYTNIQATAAGNLKVSVEELLEGAAVPIVFDDALWFLFSEFGELRATNPANRSDTEFIYDAQPLLYDNISTTDGLVTHQSASRDLVMTIGTTDPSVVAGVRKHYHIPYTPGSGQEIDLTGTLNEGDVAGGTTSLFLRSNVTGTVSETIVNQTAWDNPSTDLDFSNSQIFRLSFQSLKVGRIQFAVVPDGIPRKVHQITNDNIRKTGYWQYASLPPYAAIYSTTDGNTVSEIGYGDTDNAIGFRYTVASSTDVQLRYICETVKTQGGQEIQEMPGYQFSADNYLTAKTVSSTLIPVLSIKVADLFNSLANKTLILPESFSIQTNNPIYYQIIYRPTLTGASWVSVDTTYSGVQYDVTANAVSGGVIIESDYLTSGLKNQQIVSSGVLGRVIMALGHVGVSDILTIAAIRTTASDASVLSTLKWKEIR